jgi:hypothetical protein
MVSGESCRSKHRQYEMIFVSIKIYFIPAHASALIFYVLSLSEGGCVLIRSIDGPVCVRAHKRATAA